MADSDFTSRTGQDSSGDVRSRCTGGRSLPFVVSAGLLVALLVVGMFFLGKEGASVWSDGGYGLMQRMAGDVGRTLGLQGEVRERTVLVFRPPQDRAAWLAAEENFLVRHLFEDTFLGSTKQLELEAAARAGMGYEFMGEWILELDADTRHAVIRPPAPQLLFLELSGFRTLRDQSGVWNWLTPEDRDRTVNQMREIAHEHLDVPALAERADSSLRRTLERIFSSAGITVEWIAQPPLIPAATPAP